MNFTALEFPYTTKVPVLPEFLDPCEATQSEFEQVKEAILAQVQRENKSILFSQILDPYEEVRSKFTQINEALFAHV